MNDNMCLCVHLSFLHVEQQLFVVTVNHNLIHVPFTILWLHKVNGNNVDGGVCVCAHNQICALSIYVIHMIYPLSMHYHHLCSKVSKEVPKKSLIHNEKVCLYKYGKREWIDSHMLHICVMGKGGNVVHLPSFSHAILSFQTLYSLPSRMLWCDEAEQCYLQWCAHMCVYLL